MMRFSAIPSFIICTVAFALTLASTFSPEWLLIYKDNDLYGSAGLIRICAASKCIFAGRKLLQTHALRAVMVFSVFSGIFFFACVILFGIAMVKKSKSVFKLGGACAILGALMSMIAAAIYTAENPLSEAPEGFNYFYGFSHAFAWVVAALGFLGGGLAFVSQIGSPKIPSIARNSKRRMMSVTNSSSSESPKKTSNQCNAMQVIEKSKEHDTGLYC